MGKAVRSWERLAALFATAVALALNLAACVELFEPQTTFGYQLIYTNGFEVAGVDPETAAARAGVAAGDHLDFTKSKLHDRIIGLAYQPARPGESVTFIIAGEKGRQRVTLRAGLLTPGESRQALLSPLRAFSRLAGFVYIAVALMILLRRPTRMTWGLFLYLVSATDVTIYRFPDAIFPFAQLASDILDIAGPIGLVIFAARFPNDGASGWRAWLDRLAIPIGALFAIPNLAWDGTSLLFGTPPSTWMSYGSTLGALVLIAIAAITLIATYFAARPSDRQRFQWVIAGVLITLLSYASSWARYWSTTYGIASSDPLVWTATILYACAPFAIAYAVVRQRVFEISFVVSRTLIYTIVTAIIFGFITFVEWLAGRIVEHSGVAVALVAFSALAVGFSFHAIYGWSEQFVERTVFRKRHLAEKQLAGIAAGLPYAENSGAVEDALVREPVQAYALDSAALFSRNEAGDYVQTGEVLDASIPLRLAGKRKALRLDHGDRVLAVPVFVRSRLQAVAVYGPHTNGEDIDPDEAESLQAVGVAAGIAYDHLESARIERDLAHWRRLAGRQARELAELRANADHR